MTTIDQYLGNPNLKKAHTKSRFTPKQVEEVMKCLEDPKYFIEKYLKIVTIDKGLVPFEMYDFQRKMVDTFHEKRFTICKLPRQSGKSTIIVSYLLHYVLFNENVNVAILANKSSTARDLLGRLQLAYEHLPKWMQQGVLNWNKGSLELENGSRIVAASTSSSAVRGSTFNIIFLDEFAFVPTNIAEEFFSSVYPTITSGKSSKVMIVSTPHGMNMFYKMWMDAVNK
jgi:phage terminase large subunit-like protein